LGRGNQGQVKQQWIAQPLEVTSRPLARRAPINVVRNGIHLGKCHFAEHESR
jgi:hypothetical protein